MDFAITELHCGWNHMLRKHIPFFETIQTRTMYDPSFTHCSKRTLKWLQTSTRHIFIRPNRLMEYIYCRPSSSTHLVGWEHIVGGSDHSEIIMSFGGDNKCQNTQRIEYKFQLNLVITKKCVISLNAIHSKALVSISLIYWTISASSLIKNISTMSVWRSDMQYVVKCHVI